MSLRRNLLVWFGCSFALASLPAATVTVAVDRPGPAINPAMWGLFFEDINFGADGGLYAELVKNRGFEFPDTLLGWNRLSPSLAQGDLSVRTETPFNPKNPHYVRLASQGTAPFGISNGGFRGMGVRAGEDYDFAIQVRRIDGAPKLTIRLYGGDGTELAAIEITDLDATWQKRTARLRPRDTDAKAWLAVLVEGAGTVDLDFVSLFPCNTWKGRAGGLRADLVQVLADMKPGFFRFPGGCIVEGSDLSKRYQWKNTLGPSRNAHCSSTAGTTNSCTARPRTITNPLVSVSTSISCSARTSARNPCRS